MELSNKLVVSGGCDNKLFVWDPFRGTCLKELVGPSGYITSIIELSDGKICTGCRDSIIYIWNFDYLSL